MNDFELVKSRIDLAEFLRSRTGKALKKVGASLDLEECPFCGGHECFRISPEKQTFHCFQCDRGGDVFTFLEEAEGLDKAGALREAADYAGVELKGPKAPASLTTRDRVFDAAALYYQKALWTDGRAAYLRDERGRAQATLEALKVGYADGRLGEHLTKEAGFTREDAVKSGLVKENGKGLKDFFSPGLYVYPHLLRGRVIHFTQKDPSKEFKYQLPNKHRDKAWRFYNQDALTRYNEIIVVEGENDLQAWWDAGMKNVVGLIGQVSQEQITALRNHCKGKHLYLCLDNDEGGRKLTRKIVDGLADPEYRIRVVVFDSVATEVGRVKDIDEFFKRVKDRKQTEAKRVVDAAVTPIAWEIEQLKGLTSLEDKLLALKEHRVFERMADLVEVEKEVYTEKLLEMGFSKHAVTQQLETGHSLLKRVGQYMDRDRKDADPNVLADIIFKGFAERGRWFFDREEKCYLFYQHRIFSVGTNRPFNALMKRHTRLLPTKEPGRSVWESLASECYNRGTQVQVLSWLATDRTKDAVYVNFNSDKNTILKITPRAIKEIPNGTNDDEVLLNPSKRIMPFNFQPDCKVAEGMAALKELVFDNMTCEREQRYLVLTWLISCFLIDFAPYMGLLKFSGHSESGKTTVAKFLSLLVYGDQHLSDPTSSAAYTIAAGNPLLVIDNLEAEDLNKSILKFLLLSATKGAKEKRAGGTDTETVEEAPKALVLITAIEPFPKAELINRTYDIEFEKRFKSDTFFEDEVIEGILKKRDLILSSILKLVAFQVLPNLGKRREYNIVLKKEYRGHSKERTNEYLSLLMLLLDVVIKFVPYYEDPLESELLDLTDDGGAHDVRKRWIEYQDARAKETESETNPMLTMLNGLWREYRHLVDKADLEYDGGIGGYPLRNQEYGLDMELAEDHGSVVFEATSHDLFIIFGRLCKNIGHKMPYRNARQLGVRLSNDRASLREGNWEIVQKKDESIYYRTVHGERFVRFKKTLKDAKQ